MLSFAMHLVIVIVIIIPSCPPRLDAVKGRRRRWNVVDDLRHLQRHSNACKGVSENATLVSHC